MDFCIKVFMIIILVIGLVFLLKCLSNNRTSGGDVIGRPARIISISGKWIPNDTLNIKKYPLPERVVLEYPNMNSTTLRPNTESKIYGGSFGIVYEYQGDNGKKYMIKSLKESEWNNELHLWRNLSLRLKGLFTESYFGSPNRWMVSPEEKNDTESIYSTMTLPTFDESPPPTMGGVITPEKEREMITIDDYGIVVMEKYDGSLRNLVRQLDGDSIKSVMRQLIASLDLLKDSGFLYTDLKLDNIVYKKKKNTFTGTEYIVIKLIDIGSLCYVNKCQVAHYNPITEKQGTFPTNCPYTIMLDNDYGVKDCLNYTITICNLIMFQLSSNLDPNKATKINLFNNQAEVNSYLRFGLLELGSIISTKYSSFKAFKEALS